MRKFSSYGPINTKLHYHVPRTELIDFAHTQLVGEDPAEGGHYITVWAPRQAGKTWVMQNVLWRLQKDERFDVLKINLEHLKQEQEVDGVVQTIAQEIIADLGLVNITVKTLKEFYNVFKRDVLQKPLILIMDEFDALVEDAISGIAGVFRNIHIKRRDQAHLPTEERDYLLHGVALIGVRAVLGVENVSGSPFNVQRSMHIPNLTFPEVESIFQWYEQESGQRVEPEVIERAFYETQGQPGLVSWFGELLTETYNKHNPSITPRDFEIVFAAALYALPNNNIVNIISKAKQEPYKSLVLEMFQTSEKLPFKYDDPLLNFLYLNGVLEREIVDEASYYVKFPCPFVQKRLFNYFSGELFGYVGRLHAPFENLDDTITENSLHIPNLLRRYERYLKKNRDWLLKDAPRRTDLRVYEAVYHFNLYQYLFRFLQGFDGRVFPEFPTGNGKIDLHMHYAGQVYGIEVKSYTNPKGYREALGQAARYGRQLGLNEITLAFFVEVIDETNREKYEAVYHDDETGVTVKPVFVATG
ncbi:MAG: AAA-like domain-containing protein [Anaerolineales bacterium]